MEQQEFHIPTIERALNIERYLLSHRDQMLKIEHLLTLAGHVDLARILRFLLINQCVTKIDFTQLLLAAERAKGIKNRTAHTAQLQRFKDDFKEIKKERARDPETLGFMG